MASTKCRNTECTRPQSLPLIKILSIVLNSSGCVGFGMGGRVSLLADLILPVRAAVSFYGGGIAKTERGTGLLDRTAELHSDALRDARKTFASMEFVDADHPFFCDARPAYNKNAAEQAWNLSLAFFKRIWIFNLANRPLHSLTASSLVLAAYKHRLYRIE